MTRTARFWAVLALAACGVRADAGAWRAVALDPTHVVLQGDYSAEEHAAFALTEEEKKLGGWKFDNAFFDAQKKAQAKRPEIEAQLEAGPVTVSGNTVVAQGFWKAPHGCSRYPDGKGRPYTRGLAELVYNVYVTLGKPMKTGAKLEFALPTGEKAAFTYDPKVPSPLFKVNQVGYVPAQPRKYAYLGMWLGPLGPWPRPPDGTTFELVDAKTKKTVLSGPVTFRIADAARDKTPFTGEDTTEMDFSQLKSPGRYFVRIAGIGRSYDFEVSDEAMAYEFGFHMWGLYHKRCGIARTSDLTHWTDKACHLDVLRGVFPSNEGEYGWCFKDKDGKPARPSHFTVNRISRDRPDAEHLSLPGGWHDAADFDRRPYHMKIVGDFAALYLLDPDKYTDSQLWIPERGNGIPDLLDEAVWGLKHLIAGQRADGGVGTWIETDRHPDAKDDCTGSTDPLVYQLSRATRGSSLEYAGYAALLARALDRAGTKPAKELSRKFAVSAAKAWDYARRPCPGPVEMQYGWGGNQPTNTAFYQEPKDLFVPDLVKAAVNLAALDSKKAPEYLAQLNGKFGEYRQIVNQQGWKMSPFLFAEFKTADYDEKGDVGQMKKFWNERCVREADAMLAMIDSGYAYRMPYFPPNSGWVHSMSWGGCHMLRRALQLCAAHAITGDAKYLEGAYLANDFQSGCNPNGTTWTSGLGIVFPVRFLDLTSVADDIAEYVPGISPYRNSFGVSPKVREWVWTKGETEQLPFWRRYADIEEYTVATSEYTVWETIAPAAAACAYLTKPGVAVRNPNREPAKDIRDLPGYWMLP